MPLRQTDRQTGPPRLWGSSKASGGLGFRPARNIWIPLICPDRARQRCSGRSEEPFYKRHLWPCKVIEAVIKALNEDINHALTFITCGFSATHHVFTHRIRAADPRRRNSKRANKYKMCMPHRNPSHLHKHTHTRPGPAVLDAAQASTRLFIHIVRSTFLLPGGTGH